MPVCVACVLPVSCALVEWRGRSPLSAAQSVAMAMALTKPNKEKQQQTAAATNSPNNVCAKSASRCADTCAWLHALVVVCAGVGWVAIFDSFGLYQRKDDTRNSRRGNTQRIQFDMLASCRTFSVQHPPPHSPHW